MQKRSYHNPSGLDPEEQEFANQLDYAKDHPEMAPHVEVPPDEFQKIMDELEKKGVTERIHDELLHGKKDPAEEGRKYALRVTGVIFVILLVLYFIICMVKQG